VIKVAHGLNPEYKRRQSPGRGARK
jgi:hypothetical protein